MFIKASSKFSLKKYLGSSEKKSELLRLQKKSRQKDLWEITPRAKLRRTGIELYFLQVRLVYHLPSLRFVFSFM